MQTIYLTATQSKLIGKIRQAEDLIAVFCDSTLGAFSVILPKASEMADKVIFFFNTGANTVTIQAVGEYIDAGETYSLTVPKSRISLLSDFESNTYRTFPNVAVFM